MKASLLEHPFQAALRRVRWRLTLTYLLVTLTVILMLAWWGLVMGTLYLQRASPAYTWLEIIQEQLLPALQVILPSALVLIVPAALISAYFGFLNARWIDLRLAHLRSATRAWQQGDFSVKITDEAADEISAFGQDLNRMAEELECLVHARGELAALEERHHLARDLHDSVKQQITAASFQIGAASALLDQNVAAARSCLVEAENLTQAAHQELNAIIFELRPASFQPGDLAQTLREYTDGWARQNPIAVQLEIQGEAYPDPIVQQDLFRLVQEALSNVARHSRATRVEISLRADRLELVLSIQDNGCGFEPENTQAHGMGLQSMRERITRAGGQFSLASQPGQGTRLTAALPLPQAGHGMTARPSLREAKETDA